MKKDVHTPSVRIDPELYSNLKLLSEVRKISLKEFANNILKAEVKKLRHERLLELLEKSSVEKVEERIETLFQDLKRMERKLQKEKDALMSGRK